MCARGWIDEGKVITNLIDAAVACALVQDDGRVAVEKTIMSGLRAGMKSPHDDLPPSPKGTETRFNDDSSLPRASPAFEFH